MSPYCPDQNSSLTQYPSAFLAFAVERGEISGLARQRIAALCRHNARSDNDAREKQSK